MSPLTRSNAPNSTLHPSVETENEVDTNTCILAANGDEVLRVEISGENCINNGVDRGGADFNDYHATITGELLRDGWELFSTKDQEITVNYRLGSPGTTTQNVHMNIIECDGNLRDTFFVSQGDGKRVLQAKKGDRFNIVTKITSGCYGRRDTYDMIEDQLRAFRIW